MQGAAQGSRTAQPVRDVQNDPRPGPQFIPAPAQGASEPRFDAVPAPAYRYSNDRNSKGSTPARSKAPRAVALLVGVAAMAGGGWYAAKNHGPAIKEFIASKTAGKSKPAAASATTATTAVSAPEQKPAAAVPAALTPPPPEAVQAIEATLQKAGYWKIIASEFPDWYREKVDAAARLSAEGKSEAEVSKSLVQSLVELRRSQSEAALAASSETLKSLATAFKNTVTRMAKEGTPTCMAFIMSGESNDAVVPVITDPAKNAEVNAHLLAVFNAIVEGRKAATAHADPADGDYKLLVAELVKGGWTQAELELFADPKGASRTTPERYCQMMQDFFAAHLSIPDAAVQDRLLHRTLKLVVAG